MQQRFNSEIMHLADEGESNSSSLSKDTNERLEEEKNRVLERRKLRKLHKEQLKTLDKIKDMRLTSMLIEGQDDMVQLEKNLDLMLNSIDQSQSQSSQTNEKNPDVSATNTEDTQHKNQKRKQDEVQTNIEKNELEKKNEQLAKVKAAQKKYNQSENGKATRKKYAQSENGKATRKKYAQSDKGKATKKRFIERHKKRKLEEKQCPMLTKSNNSDPTMLEIIPAPSIRRETPPTQTWANLFSLPPSPTPPPESLFSEKEQELLSTNADIDIENDLLSLGFDQDSQDDDSFFPSLGG